MHCRWNSCKAGLLELLVLLELVLLMPAKALPVLTGITSFAWLTPASLSSLIASSCAAFVLSRK